MRRLQTTVAAFLIFVSGSPLFAKNPQPLVLEVPGEVPIRVENYTVSPAPDPLQLHVRIGPDAARSLEKLSARHLNQTLLVKQGDRTIFTPTIKAPIASQDLMVSFKDLEAKERFRKAME